MMKNILENVEYLIKLIKEKPCEACNNKRTLLPWLTKQEVMTHLRISETTIMAGERKKFYNPIVILGKTVISLKVSMILLPGKVKGNV